MVTNENQAKDESQARDPAVETTNQNQPNELDAKLAEIEKRWKSEISGLNRRLS